MSERLRAAARAACDIWFCNVAADEEALEHQGEELDKAFSALRAALEEEEDGASLIGAERARQIAECGWSPAHDDTHQMGELAQVAAHLALNRVDPWGLLLKHDNASNPVRRLAIAGALIAAEIDRIKRISTPTPAAPDGAVSRACKRCGGLAQVDSGNFELIPCPACRKEKRVITKYENSYSGRVLAALQAAEISCGKAAEALQHWLDTGKEDPIPALAPIERAVSRCDGSGTLRTGTGFRNVLGNEIMQIKDCPGCPACRKEGE